LDASIAHIQARIAHHLPKKSLWAKKRSANKNGKDDPMYIQGATTFDITVNNILIC
jgi:hypothetical protein